MTISKKSMKWIPWLLVLPVVIIRGFTTLYPILMTVRNSFFEMEILDRQTTEKKFWKVYAEQKRAMEQMSQELAQKKALVDQVEGSKAWKVYRAIKRV